MVRKMQAQTKIFRDWCPSSKYRTISGIQASPGLAISKACVMRRDDVLVVDKPVDFTTGVACLENALKRTKKKMASIIDDTTNRMGLDSAAIFAAQAVFLEDEALIAQACHFMAEGHGVSWSWDKSVQQFASTLSKANDPLLVTRSVDLIDVGRRVLGEINPFYRSFFLHNIPRDIILFTDDLSPSDVVQLDCKKVSGVVTALGSPISHAAILIRTLGIPMVVSVGNDILEFKNDVQAVIDGENGFVYLDLSSSDIKHAKKHIKFLAKKRDDEKVACELPVQTTDGHRIHILANISDANQVSLAINSGAEGVGLMRTEFSFLGGSDIPDEDVQFDIYRALVAAVGDKPLVIRAFDVGGDKRIENSDLLKGENSFLGVRGIRFLLRRRDLLIPQLRALYRVAREGGKPCIMFPMVISVSEILVMQKIMEGIRNDIGAPKLKLGIMIEVPAAAIMADVLSSYVDFFSIGTNDLTQYTMAIDRKSSHLTSEYDDLDPAVLRMVHGVVKGALKNACRVSVCGNIAADPFAAMILIGLGISELSMALCDIPIVKEYLRAHRFEDMKILARQALQCETAQAVRALRKSLK